MAVLYSCSAATMAAAAVAVPALTRVVFISASSVQLAALHRADNRGAQDSAPPATLAVVSEASND
jgi:hypothetical protein